jgi:hypothetical protein
MLGRSLCDIATRRSAWDGLNHEGNRWFALAACCPASQIAALSAGKALFRAHALRRIKAKRLAGGGGGIRTPETLAGLTVFKTGAFNHSATPPVVIEAHAGILGLITDRALRSGWEGGGAFRVWIPRSIPVRACPYHATRVGEIAGVPRLDCHLPACERVSMCPRVDSAVD